MEIPEVYQKNKESDRQCKDCVYNIENYKDILDTRFLGDNGAVHTATWPTIRLGHAHIIRNQKGTGNVYIRNRSRRKRRLRIQRYF